MRAGASAIAAGGHFPEAGHISRRPDAVNWAIWKNAALRCCIVLIARHDPQPACGSTGAKRDGAGTRFGPASRDFQISKNGRICKFADVARREEAPPRESLFSKFEGANPPVRHACADLSSEDPGVRRHTPDYEWLSRTETRPLRRRGPGLQSSGPCLRGTRRLRQD
jgi:hypothetical protein